MALIIAQDIELSWGDQHVLTGCTLRVNDRERIGLVGPNGCGKSTLLSILADKARPDSGEVIGSARIAMLEQSPDFPGTTVEDVVQHALGWHVSLKNAYERALHTDQLEEAARLQEELDEKGWVVDHKIDALLTQTGAPPRHRELLGLSGGEQRRLALAATLLEQADVLLLDEPTNHLDAATITWLEKYLSGYRGAVVIVTHDRYLLESVTERIVEIEHGKAVSYDGSYADYLISRAERRARQEKLEDRRLQILARECAWASRSPAARSTKQRARLKRLEGLQAAGALPKTKSFSLDFSTGLKTSGTVLEVHNLHVRLGGKLLLDGLDLMVRPGERVGIVGPNGIGKSTLLRAIHRELTPDAGEIIKAPRVKIGMLDQDRTGLDPTDTVFDAAGGGNDQVLVGETWIHVATFLNRLLFSRDQFDAKVSGLSGGERARLLLAKKMLEGNSVLLLDEPTNDLDLWTLRVLEEALLSFDGAALIVTHDRAFLDRVCTAVLNFEGNGVVVRYADRLQADRATAARLAPVVKKGKKPPRVKKEAPKKQKLSFKETRELAELPEQIELSETRVEELESTLNNPNTYSNGTDIKALTTSLEQLQSEIEGLYARWELLSERS